MSSRKICHLCYINLNTTYESVKYMYKMRGLKFNLPRPKHFTKKEYFNYNTQLNRAIRLPEIQQEQ